MSDGSRLGGLRAAVPEECREPAERMLDALLPSGSFLDTIEEAFWTHDFSNLPRCAECFKNPAAKPPLTDRIWRYAQIFPWKDPFRRLLNLPGGEN